MKYSHTLVFLSFSFAFGCKFSFQSGSGRQTIDGGEENKVDVNSANNTKEEKPQDCDKLWNDGKRSAAMECYEKRDGLKADALPTVVSEEDLPEPLQKLLKECKKKHENITKCLEANTKDSTKDTGSNPSDNGVGTLPNPE